MEYFISWYPDPPDPRSWDWFKTDGLMISFASLKGPTLRKAVTLGLHQFTGFKGRIFLDSGAFQFGIKGTRKSQIEILEVQHWLDPDLVSHLDKPYVNLERIPEKTRWSMLKDTVENAKVARKWEKNNDNDIQVVYVIQGWERQSLRLCAKKMSRLNADYYGVGSLYRQPISEIVGRVKLVRKIIGEKPKLHIFGVSLLRADQKEILKEVFHLVDSLDSSSAVRAATVKEVFDPISRKREHINYFGGILSNCGCPVCEQFPNRVRLLGLKGSQKQYNRFRAIHNAYWLTKLAHLV